MQTLIARFEAVKLRIGGNREKTGFEYTFGQPKEEFFHVTMPARICAASRANCSLPSSCLASAGANSTR